MHASLDIHHLSFASAAYLNLWWWQCAVYPLNQLLNLPIRQVSYRQDLAVRHHWANYRTIVPEEPSSNSSGAYRICHFVSIASNFSGDESVVVFATKAANILDLSPLLRQDGGSSAHAKR